MAAGGIDRFLAPFLIAALLVTASCGKDKDGDDEEGPSSPPDDTVLEVGTLFDPLQTFDEAFSNSVGSLVADGAGGFWDVSGSIDQVGGDSVSRLEHRSASLAVTSQVELASGRSHFNLVVHPSGRMTMLEFEIVDEVWFAANLAIIRLDSSGSELKRLDFSSLDFDLPADVSCNFEAVAKTFMGRTSVTAAAVGESLALHTWNCFYTRLTLLDEDLNVTWSHPVTPYIDELGLALGFTGLAVSDDGTMIATNTLEGNTIDSYNTMFADDLVAVGDSDIVAVFFNGAGDRTGAAVYGTAGPDYMKDIRFVDQTMFLLGNSSVENPDPNIDRVDDLLLIGAGLADGAVVFQKLIDVAREDTPTAMEVVDGDKLLLGGYADFVQVNTGSVVEYADGFLLLTDLSGNELGRRMFGTARHDGVASMLQIAAGKVLVGGFLEGPITHDGDQDKSNTYSHAFLGVLDLERF